MQICTLICCQTSDSGLITLISGWSAPRYTKARSSICRKAYRVLSWQSNYENKKISMTINLITGECCPVVALLANGIMNNCPSTSLIQMSLSTHWCYNERKKLTLTRRLCQHNKFKVPRSPELLQVGFWGYTLSTAARETRTRLRIPYMNASWNLNRTIVQNKKKMKKLERYAYFSSSTVSSTPNPDARHLPPTLNIAHPCFHPTART